MSLPEQHDSALTINEIKDIKKEILDAIFAFHNAPLDSDENQLLLLSQPHVREHHLALTERFNTLEQEFKKLEKEKKATKAQKIKLKDTLSQWKALRDAYLFFYASIKISLQPQAKSEAQSQNNSLASITQLLTDMDAKPLTLRLHNDSLENIINELDHIKITFNNFLLANENRDLKLELDSLLSKLRDKNMSIDMAIMQNSLFTFKVQFNQRLAIYQKRHKMNIASSIEKLLENFVNEQGELMEEVYNNFQTYPDLAQEFDNIESNHFALVVQTTTELNQWQQLKLRVEQFIEHYHTVISAQENSSCSTQQNSTAKVHMLLSPKKSQPSEQVTEQTHQETKKSWFKRAWDSFKNKVAQIIKWVFKIKQPSKKLAFNASRTKDISPMTSIPAEVKAVIGKDTAFGQFFMSKQNGEYSIQSPEPVHVITPTLN